MPFMLHIWDISVYDKMAKEGGKHMDFFSKLGETITATGKDVSQKAKDLTGIAKLNLDIRNKEDFIQRQYTEIGKQYYELHKEDVEPFFEEMKLITEALQEKEQLQSELADLKGQKKCHVCGAINEMEAVYCNQCGAKCESIFEEEDTPVQTDTEEEVKEEIVVEALEKETEEKDA